MAAEGRSGDCVRLRLRSPEGVDVDAHGVIVVNDRLETTAADTWALGDCAGSPQQTHVSLADHRIVKANVFAAGRRSTTDRLVPHAVLIDPELGRVGWSEREAGRQGGDVRVATVPLSVVARARTLGETRGLMKAVIDGRSDRILGFAMLGAGAGEVAAIVQRAMLGRLPFTTLRERGLAHPTMAEGLNYLFAGIAEVP